MTQLPNRTGLPSDHRETPPYGRELFFHWHRFIADTDFGVNNYPDTYANFAGGSARYGVQAGADQRTGFMLFMPMPQDYRGGPLRVKLHGLANDPGAGTLVAFFATAKVVLPGADYTQTTAPVSPQVFFKDFTGLSSSGSYVMTMDIPAPDTTDASWSPDCILVLYFGRDGDVVEDDHEESVYISHLLLYY